jgi:hypothetical protein
VLVQRPTLNPLARAALVEIQAAGVEITPDIVLWAHAAAERIRKVPPRAVADLVDWPCMAGGAALYPLTFGAVAWLGRLPDRMRNDVRCIAYAMAHGKDPAALERLNTLAASLAVTRWVATLTCSRDALAAAVDLLLGNEDYVEVKDAIKRKRDPESVEWGAVVRALCTKYPGTTGAYWTWQVSREHCYAMLQQINDELPDGQQVTDYEVEMNAQFRSIVEHVKAEAANG